ncbi:DEKNAAC105084, partial [Brettanomyces naardenensis]
MDENVGNSLDYLEKSNPFECGFDSFRQSTNPVPIPFILIALLFLPFDLEVSSMLPYIVSSYSTGLYGLIFFIIFLLILVIGFTFELNSKAISLFRFLPKSINKSLTIYL